jgi:hypothetical protein
MSITEWIFLWHGQVLYVSEHVLERALAGVPDSYRLPAQKLDQLPEFVKNLRCQQYIEDGVVEDEWSCLVEKFNVSICETRPYKTCFTLLRNIASAFAFLTRFISSLKITWRSYISLNILRCSVCLAT